MDAILNQMIEIVRSTALAGIECFLVDLPEDIERPIDQRHRAVQHALSRLGEGGNRTERLI